MMLRDVSDVKVALGMHDVERFSDFKTFHRSMVFSRDWKVSTGLRWRAQFLLDLDELVAAFGAPSVDTETVRCPYYFRIDDQFVCFYISGSFGDVKERQFFNVVCCNDRAVEVLRLYLLESAVYLYPPKPTLRFDRL